MPGGEIQYISLEHFALLKQLHCKSKGSNFNDLARQILGDDVTARIPERVEPVLSAAPVEAPEPAEALAPVLPAEPASPVEPKSVAEIEPVEPVELPSPTETLDQTEPETPALLEPRDAVVNRAVEEGPNFCAPAAHVLPEDGVLQEEGETEPGEGAECVITQEKLEGADFVDPVAELQQMEEEGQICEIFVGPVPAYTYYDERGALHAVYPEQLVQEEGHGQELGSYAVYEHYQAQEPHWQGQYAAEEHAAYDHYCFPEGQQQGPFFNQGYGTLAQQPPPVQPHQSYSDDPQNASFHGQYEPQQWVQGGHQGGSHGDYHAENYYYHHQQQEQHQQYYYAQQQQHPFYVQQQYYAQQQQYYAQQQQQQQQQQWW